MVSLIQQNKNQAKQLIWNLECCLASFLDWLWFHPFRSCMPGGDSLFIYWTWWIHISHPSANHVLSLFIAIQPLSLPINQESWNNLGIFVLPCICLDEGKFVYGRYSLILLFKTSFWKVLRCIQFQFRKETWTFLINAWICVTLEGTNFVGKPLYGQKRIIEPSSWVHGGFRCHIWQF